MESDVYAPSRRPNIPCQRYKDMLVWSLKWCPQRGLTTYLASSYGTNLVRRTIVLLGTMLLQMNYVINGLLFSFCKYKIAQNWTWQLRMQYLIWKWCINNWGIYNWITEIFNLACVIQELKIHSLGSKIHAINLIITCISYLEHLTNWFMKFCWSSINPRSNHDMRIKNLTEN